MSSAIAMVRRNVNHRGLIWPRPNCLSNDQSREVLLQCNTLTYNRMYNTVVDSPSTVDVIPV